MGDEHEKPKRSAARAKVACQACNARRVRCDIALQRPCQNCRERHVPCEPIVSRRGKYVRTKARKSAEPKDGFIRRPSETTASTASPTFKAGLSPAPHPPELSLSNAGPLPPIISANSNPVEDASTHQKGDQGGTEMLYARITETSSGREMAQQAQLNNGRTYYLNEPFSLAYLVRVVCNPSGDTSNISVHSPIPGAVPDRAGDGIYMDATQREHLKSRGAFNMPEKRVGDELIQVYFDCFHPAYPVFDRKTFADLYESGKLSPLVLQTLFYIGATHCDERLIKDAGFPDRSEARIAFYLRAKALYDSDYERDKVTVTAVLFILGFVWHTPEDQKDSWHWLGQAISLAQTLGMHRSTARSGLRPHHRSLWKRIWWSIYIRDRHTAAALGRPVRIRDEDCDVEMLGWSDFQDDETTGLGILGSNQAYHTHYAIEMAKNAVIMGYILTAKFAVGAKVSRDELDGIARQLTDWKNRLPPELQLGMLDSALGGPFWGRMIDVAYCLCQMLLHRPCAIATVSAVEAEREAPAIAAANNMTRIAEDLLTSGTLRYGQLHLIPTLFAALSVHSLEICRRDNIRRRLAENRSRQCMLALNELSKSWPVGGWILRLFISLMRRLTGGDFGFEDVLKANSLKPCSDPLNRQQPNTSMPVPRSFPLDSGLVSRPAVPGAHMLFSEPAVMLPLQQYQQLEGPLTWGQEQDVFTFDNVFQDVLMPSTPHTYGPSGNNGFA